MQTSWPLRDTQRHSRTSPGLRGRAEHHARRRVLSGAKKLVDRVHAVSASLPALDNHATMSSTQRSPLRSVRGGRTCAWRVTLELRLTVVKRCGGHDSVVHQDCWRSTRLRLLMLTILHPSGAEQKHIEPRPCRVGLYTKGARQYAAKASRRSSQVRRTLPSVHRDGADGTARPLGPASALVGGPRGFLGDYSGTYAIASISTKARPGKAPTCTVVRAGGGSLPKYSAYTAL